MSAHLEVTWGGIAHARLRSAETTASFDPQKSYRTSYGPHEELRSGVAFVAAHARFIL